MTFYNPNQQRSYVHLVPEGEDEGKQSSYSKLNQKQKKESIWTLQRPHGAYGWGTSIWMVFWFSILLAILIYCNCVYIASVKFTLYTDRPSVYPNGGKTVIFPDDEPIYKINLMSDVNDLWHGCVNVYDTHQCGLTTTKTTRTMGSVLFFWSILFPFLKLFISLCFWFFPVPRCIREWVMFVKVNIGRGSILEAFFVFYWTYGFGFTYDVDVSKTVGITGLEAHVDSCFTYTAVTALFVAAQIGSLMLSHWSMKKAERLNQPNHNIKRVDNILQDWSFNIPFYETDRSAPSKDPEDAFTCLTLWDVDGYFVNFFISGLLITNLSFLIRIIFVDRLFTQQLSGQAVSIIPELANVQELGIYKMITKLPSVACGWGRSVQFVMLFAMIIFPLVSSILLLCFWISMFLPMVSDEVRSHLRSFTAMFSVYACLDVAMLGLYYADNYWPQIIESLFGDAGVLEGDISTGPAYELAIISSIVHWTLMLHILTRPFKAERRRKVTELHHEKERAALSPGVHSLGGSLSLQETRQNIGS